MNVGNLVTVVPLERASRRTVNRIAENGPVFKIRSMPKEVSCLGGKRGIMLVSEKTGWFGWLLTSEISVYAKQEF